MRFSEKLDIFSSNNLFNFDPHLKSISKKSQNLTKNSKVLCKYQIFKKKIFWNLFLKGNLNAFNGLNSVGYNYIKSYKNTSSDKFSNMIYGIKTSIYSNSSLGESFMKNISFSLDYMLLSCFYDGNKCYSSNFTQFTTYDRGNCFTFNYITNGIHTSKQSGPFYGLQLELFNGFDGNWQLLKSI